MKYLFTLLMIASLSSNLYAQSVNDYKYVIVPEKYDFLKSPDQYQVNSLTKFLFNKYGFEAYKEKDKEILKNPIDPCEALYAQVTSESTFIQAKLTVILKDCNDQVIFKTSEGRSKNKDYKKAYHGALREAFLDIEALQYNYNPSATAVERKTTKIPESSIAKDKSPDLDEKKQIVSKTSSMPAAIIFTSEDGFYKAKQTGTTITFYDDTKKIGLAEMGNGEAFDVTTTDFSGTAFFLEGRLVVQRKIKGIAGVVEMIFTKE
ncbi:hypothetical protein [uncultured Dokdonia sp.]|uniref:hypothetical protein n=1 Tax=uncultured Dokdonia sp. TaxID=575653 RepID=UPI002615823A|nr:hypothetical protein [uncultured Dokdonia sp.]